jgi:large subunit ribosomal protein L25
MELTIQRRDITGKKVQALRKANLVPGIIYGKHLDAPIMISCDKTAFIKAYKQGWSATAITLKGDSVKELALVQDIQLDPVNDYVLHVDFHAVKADEKVHVSVPVILIGASSVEKLGEGKVQLVKDTIEVEAFPQDLPHDVTIDISTIATINDVVFVKDIDLGNKVSVLTDPEQALVTVVVIEDEVESSDEAVDPAGNAVAAKKEAEKASN